MKKLALLGSAILFSTVYWGATMAGQAWASAESAQTPMLATAPRATQGAAFGTVGRAPGAAPGTAPSPQSQPSSTPNLVARAFRLTGARAAGFEVHDWTTTNTPFLAVSLLRQEARQTIARLGVAKPTGWVHQDSHQHVSFFSGTTTVHSAQGAIIALTATVELASMNLPGQSPQTVLVVRLIAKQKSLAGSHAAFALVKSVLPAQGSSNVNEMAYGALPTMVSENNRAAKIRRVFSQVSGIAFQWSQDSYTTSAAGNSAQGGLFLQAGKQDINLQVAMHTNDYNQTTRVLVGSPLITVEY